MAGPTPNDRVLALHARVPTVALAYLTFVIYGSLVPLEVRHIDLAAAWQKFMAVPYLDLSVAQREDWIANGILYLPLGLLLAATLSPGTRPSSRLAGAVLGLVLASAVAVGVEFTQVFFIGRSVTINDLLAEGIGALAGVLLWAAWGGRIAGAVVQVGAGSSTAIGTAIALYLGAYAFMSLFPFDFLISLDELQWKLAEHPPRLLLGGDTCNSSLHCTVKLPLEMMAALPLGVMLALRAAREARGWGLPRLLLAGCCLGLLVETAQAFTANGRSHGLSILATGLGVPAGYLLGRWLVVGGGFTRALARARALVVVATPAYLVVLAWVNRIEPRAPVSLEQALERLASTRMVPFFYHYFSPESVALVSLGAGVVMYMPVGVLVWAWRGGGASSAPARDTVATFWIATGLATATWLARMFFADHSFADPTNILIAGLAAIAGLGAIRILENWMAVASGNIPEGTTLGRTRDVHRIRHSLAGFLAIGLLIVLLAAHPLAVIVAPVCLLYAALLFTFPSAWLVVVPAALPVFDLGGSTGWILVEEIDLVVLTTVAVLSIRSDPVGHRAPLSGGWRLLIALLTLCYLVSAGKGLVPLAPLDADAFAEYRSPWNAVRILRIVLLPLLLFPFLREALARDTSAGDKLAAGVLIGLVGVGASVVWERYLFAGIVDLAEPFRVAGPFSGMNIGGQQIDAYLAGALPFVAWFAIRPRSWPWQLLAAAAITLGLYTVIVTFTRWTYLMTLASALVLLAGWAVARRNSGLLRRRDLTSALVLIGAGVAALLVVSLSDTFMRERLRFLDHDAAKRTDHWASILAIRDQGADNDAFGAGLGSFPRVFQDRLPDIARSARVFHQRQGSSAILTLVGGTSVFVEQRVRLEGTEAHRLRITVRGVLGSGRLTVGLCEKTVMYSRECVYGRVPVDSGEAWHTHEIPLAPGAVGLPLEGAPGWVRRPVYFAVFSPPAGAVVEVQAISLMSPAGDELLRNGSFLEGRDYWRFTSDEHIQWHAKNLPLLVLFEQGWLGLLLVTALFASAVARLSAGLGRGRAEAAVLLTALFGMLFIGFTGSVLDSPRVGFLLYLIVFWSVAHPWRRMQPPP